MTGGDMQKAVSEDPMWVKWQQIGSSIYDEIYYETNPVVAYVNNYGHHAVERPFGADRHFSQVLEIGAGTGEHLKYVRHSYDRYLITDLSRSQLEVAARKHSANPKVTIEPQNALALSYPDSSFDRLISIYNLEHLPDPHRALEEWRRACKPGGMISIALPTEGGIAWNTGRYLTTRRSFKAKGLDLDYIIAREHINPCYRLVSLINHYFKEKSTFWFPLRIPSAHLNLVYACNIINRK